jgi:hypothetical protein
MQQHNAYHQNLNQSDKDVLCWHHAANMFRQRVLTTAHPQPLLQPLRNLKHSGNFIHNSQEVLLTDRSSDLLHGQRLQNLHAHLGREA